MLMMGLSHTNSCTENKFHNDVLFRGVSPKTGAVERADKEVQGPWVWPSNSQNFPVPPKLLIHEMKGQTRTSSQLSSSSNGWQVPGCLRRHFPVYSKHISLNATPNVGFSVTSLPQNNGSISKKGVR